MGRLARLLLLSVALACLGTAEAGLVLDGPIAYAELRDGRTEDCEQAFHACPATYDTSPPSPGDWSIDAYQRIDGLYVATNGSAAEDLSRGMLVLPDRSIVVRGNDLFITHPGFSNAAEASAEAMAIWPAPDYLTVLWTSEGVSILYLGPSAHDLEHPVAPRNYTIVHEDRGLGYEQVGPHNAPGGTPTDEQVAHSRDACDFALNDSTCFATVDALAETQREWTPSLSTGLEFYDAAVATDPSLLPAAARNETAAAVNERRTNDSVPSAIPTASRDRSGADGPSDTASPLPSPSREDPTTNPRPGPAAPPEATIPMGIALTPAVLPVVVGIAVGVIGVVLAGLYSRFARRDAIVEHHTRAAIMSILKDTETILATDLQRKLGIRRTALLHHIGMLSRQQFVRCSGVGGRLVVSRAQGEGGQAALFAALEPARRDILKLLLRSRGSMDRREIHALLESHPHRTRNHAISRLKAIGLIEADGHRIALSPSFLATYGGPATSEA